MEESSNTGRTNGASMPRTWSEAQQNATKPERDLEALIQGKPARKSVTVEAEAGFDI
jgi:hypothetical protein